MCIRDRYERYQSPIYITENGLSCHDTVSSDGKVHDQNRIDFLEGYLRQLKRASENGADIRGYFHWSLMDNFEWHSGYADRFGMIYVDYRTQAVSYTHLDVYKRQPVLFCIFSSLYTKVFL